MKFLIRFILIAVLGYFLPFYMPWWILIIISFVIGFMVYGPGFNLFLAGFLGGGLVWLGLSFKLHTDSGGILTDKMISIFGYEDGIVLILAAGILGGLIAGFSIVTGSSFRKLFLRKVKKSFYS